MPTNFVPGTTITSSFLNSVDSNVAGSCNVFDYLTDAQIADVLAHTYIYDLAGSISIAYATAAVLHKQLRFPAGGYRIASTLTWDQSVDILGQSSEFTIFKKDVTSGDFDGIVIGGAGQQSIYSNFTLTTTGTVSTGVGIKVLGSARMVMDKITIDHQGSHGLWLYDSAITGRGVFSSYKNLSLNTNGGDGIRIEKHYASYFENLNLNGNTGYGFNLVQGNSHVGKAIICESNVAGGAYIDLAVANSLEIYGESNIGTDLSLSPNSTRTEVFMYHSGGVSDLSDEGTNSMIRDVGTFPMFSCPVISRIPRTTNTVGRDLYVIGGRSGPGTSGHIGGSLVLLGGDSAGDTLARGGTALLQGGEGVHGGRSGDVYVTGGVTTSGGAGYGDVFITNANYIAIDPGSASKYIDLGQSKSPVRIGGVTTISDSVGLDLQSLTQAMRLNRLTTTGINNLTVTSGQAMFAYNQTLGCPVFYDGVAWQKLSFTAM